MFNVCRLELVFLYKERLLCADVVCKSLSVVTLPFLDVSLT